MSDESVASALRSAARLVVIEAPAGCGKTYQGADYACAAAETVGDGRVLILTHTHAACDVFASRTRHRGPRVDIRTIDGLVAQIAGAYHLALGLPPDPGAWARSQRDGYALVAAKVAALLRASPMIGRCLARRYPVVVCDEHQDASADQHAVALALHGGGSALRIFADPVQRIYGSRKKAEILADDQRWEDLKQRADLFDNLDEPHRWSGDSKQLGRWILEARNVLRDGGQVDLTGTLPEGVSVLVAENQAPEKSRAYRLTKGDAGPVYKQVRARESLLVLAAHNDMVNALRGLFGRSLPIWEGHVRDGLCALVEAVARREGDPSALAEAFVTFLQHVATGFSRSAFGDTLCSEVAAGCVARRTGKPATLQALGRIILGEPDHKGVVKALRYLSTLIAEDPAFNDVKIDYTREFWEAIRLGQFDDPNEGFVEISRRRANARPALPKKAISTVHKAKGLECSHVLIMPCDARHFSNSRAARCRLYVAMSRATRSLTFVASHQERSPLLKV